MWGRHLQTSHSQVRSPLTGVSTFIFSPDRLYCCLWFPMTNIFFANPTPLSTYSDGKATVKSEFTRFILSRRQICPRPNGRTDKFRPLVLYDRVRPVLPLDDLSVSDSPGELSHKTDGDARQKFWIKHLRRPNWAWLKLFVTPKKK